MVWEVTHLLLAILLVFPTSGSRTQEIVSLRRMQGETASVVCRYPPTLRRKVKSWCLQTSERSCIVLVNSRNTGDQRPQFSIQDHPEFNYFTVTMTALQPRNTGFYRCGILESSTMVTTLRTFHLLVSKDPSGSPVPGTIPTVNLTEVSTLATTKGPSIYTRYKTATQPKSAAATSSPDPRVTFTDVTNATRVPMFSIIVPVVCGLLGKTLVFIVLFAVTKRSFG